MSATLLQFEPGAHVYRLHGAIVPSVTQILRTTGVSVDFESLRDASTRVREAVDLKRDIGSALHADAHAFDDNDLVWATVDPRVEPYLRAWAAFRANTGAMPRTRERRVYHAGLNYCGTLDGIFALPNGRKVLIDIKTGDPKASGCQYQTAAYLLAYLTEHQGEIIHERWAVQLDPDRQIPYRITPYTDWRDANTWQAIVTTFHCGQAARRSA